MAGSQDPNENPVGINVVPMVDVIFCLCVFFMCSMKFKELEGKFESWLPKDKGQSQPMTDNMPIEEIRVALFYDPNTKETTRQFGKTTIRDDAQLQDLIKLQYADRVRLGRPETPVIIDAAELVPWKHVVNVVNLAKREGVDKIEFAAGKNYDAAPKK
jgi:biopolymer transport protein ExbD